MSSWCTHSNEIHSYVMYMEEEQLVHGVRDVEPKVIGSNSIGDIDIYSVR